MANSFFLFATKEIFVDLKTFHTQSLGICELCLIKNKTRDSKGFFRCGSHFVASYF